MNNLFKNKSSSFFHFLKFDTNFFAFYLCYSESFVFSGKRDVTMTWPWPIFSLRSRSFRTIPDRFDRPSPWPWPFQPWPWPFPPILNLGERSWTWVNMNLSVLNVPNGSWIMFTNELFNERYCILATPQNWIAWLKKLKSISY